MSKKRKPRNRHGQQQGAANQRRANPSLSSPQVPLASANINQQPQAVTANSGSQNEGDSDTEELTQAVDRHVRLNTLFTFVIMAATIVGAFVSYGQWSAMDRGLKQTDATLDLMREGQRPWLAFNGGDIKLPEPGGEVAYSEEMKNSGPTPCIVTAGGGRFFLVTQDKYGEIDRLIEEAIAEGPVSERENVIPPGETTEFLGFGNPKLSADDLAALRSGKLKLFIVHEYRYRELGGRRHVTRGCFFYSAATDNLRQYEKYQYMD
jgi:hypothetical protein